MSLYGILIIAFLHVHIHVKLYYMYINFVVLIQYSRRTYKYNKLFAYNRKVNLTLYRGKLW